MASMDAVPATIERDPADLDSLRRAVEAEELRARLDAASFQRRLVRGVRDQAVMEGWGDLVDPSDYLRGDPSYDLSAGRLLYPSARLGDRQDGRNYPIVQTENDLLIIRATSRLLCDTSPAAIGALQALKNYIVGTGFDFKVVPKPGVEASQGLVQAVQAFVDDFLEINDFLGDLDRELLNRSRRDGEFFLASYAQPDGSTNLRIIEPEQITEPKRPQDLEDHYGFSDQPNNWTFGIHTNQQDIQTVYGYYVQWNPSGSDWDYFPRSMIEHCKLNVDRNVKRGIPDFYAVRQYLDQADKLLRNTAMGASVQAAIAFIRKHAVGTTQAQIETMRSNNTTATFQRTVPSGQSITRFSQKMEPATVLDTSPGMEYEPGPSGGADVIGGYIAIEQAILRYAGMRWNMPEYMISGDASNANYSSTLVAESPFVRFVDAEQTIYKKPFRRVTWNAIANAVKCGRFSQFGIQSIELLKQFIDLQITPPDVSVRDDLKATKINEILSDSGILSDTDWAAREGLDFAEQQARGAKRQQPITPLNVGGAGMMGDGSMMRTESESANDRLNRIHRLWRDYP